MTDDADSTRTDTLLYPLPSGRRIKDPYMREVWADAVRLVATDGHLPVEEDGAEKAAKAPRNRRGRPPFPGAVFDESRHRWVQGQEDAGGAAASGAGSALADKARSLAAGIKEHGSQAVAAAVAVGKRAAAVGGELRARCDAAGLKLTDVLDGVDDYFSILRVEENHFSEALGVRADMAVAVGSKVLAYAAVKLRQAAAANLAGKAAAEGGADSLHELIAAVVGELLAELGVPEESLPTAADVAESLGGDADDAETKAAEGSDPPRLSWVGVDVTGPAAERLLRLGELVEDDELADDGREVEPHVTVRYGLHTDDPDLIALHVAGFGPVELTLGEVAVFAGADTGRDYDVVIVEVESDDLHRLHDRLGELNHTDTFAGYRPHATIAYVAAGMGEAIAERLNAADATRHLMAADTVAFSDADKNRTLISLE